MVGPSISTLRESTMLTPPASPEYSLGLMSEAATWPSLRVAVLPGSGAISSSAAEYLLQTWIGEVKVPARHTTVVDVMEFSFLAIQELIIADVPPLAEAKMTVHDVGAAACEPVGVAGFGISPSPSAGTAPWGSIGNELAVTSGGGWVTVAAPGAAQEMANAVRDQLSAVIAATKTAPGRCGRRGVRRHIMGRDDLSWRMAGIGILSVRAGRPHHSAGAAATPSAPGLAADPMPPPGPRYRTRAPIDRRYAPAGPAS